MQSGDIQIYDTPAKRSFTGARLWGAAALLGSLSLAVYAYFQF